MGKMMKFSACLGKIVYRRKMPSTFIIFVWLKRESRQHVTPLYIQVIAHHIDSSLSDDRIIETKMTSLGIKRLRKLRDLWLWCHVHKPHPSLWIPHHESQYFLSSCLGEIPGHFCSQYRDRLDRLERCSLQLLASTECEGLLFVH